VALPETTQPTRPKVPLTELDQHIVVTLTGAMLAAIDSLGRLWNSAEQVHKTARTRALLLQLAWL